MLGMSKRPERDPIAAQNEFMLEHIELTRLIINGPPGAGGERVREVLQRMWARNAPVDPVALVQEYMEMHEAAAVVTGLAVKALAREAHITTDDYLLTMKASLEVDRDHGDRLRGH